MKLGSRAKLLLIVAGFALPIAASYLAYYFTTPAPTGNYGELLLPPAALPAARLERPGGTPWSFEELRGRWALVVADSGRCGAPCTEKLTTLRQVQLALGRNASRVSRLYVVDDGARPDPAILAPFEGMAVAFGAADGLGILRDRERIYLVDPNGNVMMRWPAGADRKRMLKDLERLLKASQIGHNDGLLEAVLS